MTIAAENLPTFIYDLGMANDRQITEGDTWKRTFQFRDEDDNAIPFTGWTLSPIIYDGDPAAPLAAPSTINGDASGNITVTFTAAHTTAAGKGTHNWRLRGTDGTNTITFLCGKFVIKDCDKARLST